MKPFLLAATAALVAMPASAAVLVVDTGWQYDEIVAADTPSIESIWTLTLATPPTSA